MRMETNRGTAQQLTASMRAMNRKLAQVGQSWQQGDQPVPIAALELLDALYAMQAEIMSLADFYNARIAELQEAFDADDTDD